MEFHNEPSDRFFVTEESGARYLLNESAPEEWVFLTGNVMIDTLKLWAEKSMWTNRVLERIEKGKINKF